VRTQSISLGTFRYFLRPPGDPPKSGLYWDGFQAAWVQKRDISEELLGNEAELEDIISTVSYAKAEGSRTGDHSVSSDAGSRASTSGIVTRTARRADQVVDSTAWLQPEFPPAVVDGKFVRPKGNAPIDGYVWCSKKGEHLLAKRTMFRQVNNQFASLVLFSISFFDCFLRCMDSREEVDWRGSKCRDCRTLGK
jgi:hypothetical protein